jgi:hypothetical protein
MRRQMRYAASSSVSSSSLAPSPARLDATLYGELGTIVEWVARVGKVGLKHTTIISVACVSASVNRG